MDTITHSLLGALVVRAAFPAQRWRFGDAGPEAERVEMLWHNEQLDYFRRFAEFPVLYRIDEGTEKFCVWFTDLRYVLPYMTPPFRYGLCQETRDLD